MVEEEVGESTRCGAVMLLPTIRLWQLRNRRFSRDERGGLNGIVSEQGWIRGVLAPEIRIRRQV